LAPQSGEPTEASHVKADPAFPEKRIRRGGDRTWPARFRHYIVIIPSVRNTGQQLVNVFTAIENALH
jgi:hypothetical protein